MEENLGFHDLKDFSHVLQTEEHKSDVIVRKGDPSDVLDSDPNEDKADDLSSSHGMTEEEFNKEFKADLPDSNETFESDSRKDLSRFVQLLEREEMAVEDLADTISSSEMFQGGFSRKLFLLKIKLPEEDPRTIDIDLQEEANQVIIYSHKYKLRAYFHKPISMASVKSSFTKESQMLELIVRQQK